MSHFQHVSKTRITVILNASNDESKCYGIREEKIKFYI